MASVSETNNARQFDHVLPQPLLKTSRMAPARRARLPTESDNESDPETEQETPRPQRSGIRKRLSEVYNPDNDASFVQDAAGVRVPLRSVNINDDAAEKRRRRKSTKITVVENAMAGPSSEGTAANDVPEGSRAAKQKQQLNSVDPTSLLNLPREIMSSNFEEWMKMATDNVRSFPSSSFVPF